jgi:hypothetical protein
MRRRMKQLRGGALRIFTAVYGIVIAVGATLVARDPSYFGNVGFLVLGTLLGIYPVFILEEIKRAREAKNLAKALFHELARAAGRCCFDFEEPWGRYVNTPVQMAIFRALKFVPDPPVIYPAVAPQIALLKDEAAQAIIDFYFSLDAWRRDLENATAEYQRVGGMELTPKDVKFLAKRLQQTLSPGKRALEALAPDIAAADEIERNALKEPDATFADKHPNAGKTIRERIAILLGTSELPAARGGSGGMTFGLRRK